MCHMTKNLFRITSLHVHLNFHLLSVQIHTSSDSQNDVQIQIATQLQYLVQHVCGVYLASLHIMFFHLPE